ncbi:MAG: iron-sulfur cluster co-chaperone HscB C-terminal domain-containing protein [Planctomycetota bacterium]
MSASHEPESVGDPVAVPHACTTCGAGLETPLACGDCGTMMTPSTEVSPFSVIGLDVAYDIDQKELAQRVRKVARLVHPDFFAAAGPTMRALAEAHGARLNEAHEVLRDDVRRADWIVRSLGGPSEEQERQMPQEFLMEVLEWNEVLDEGASAPPGSTERLALTPLEAELAGQRAQALREVTAALTPLPSPGAPALVDVRRTLNAIRYLDRALRRLRDLRVGQPS